jgi:hypothetical protein
MSKTPDLTKGEATALIFGNAEGDAGDLQQNVGKASFHVACSLR